MVQMSGNIRYMNKIVMATIQMIIISKSWVFLTKVVSASLQLYSYFQFSTFGLGFTFYAAVNVNSGRELKTAVESVVKVSLPNWRFLILGQIVSFKYFYLFHQSTVILFFPSSLFLFPFDEMYSLFQQLKNNNKTSYIDHWDMYLSYQ